MKTSLLVCIFSHFFIGIAFADNPDTATINQWLQKAEEFIDAGKYDKVFSPTSEALKLYERKALNFPRLLIDIYDLIGLGHRKKGAYTKSLDFYEKMLEEAATKFGKTDIIVAKSHNELGTAYYYLRDYDRALIHYEQALALALDLEGIESEVVASSYNNLGICYYLKRNFRKALDFYKKSLSIAIQKFGEVHPKVAATYNNIGICYGQLDDYNQAISYYQKALAIKMELHPTGHPDLVPNHNSLGSCYKSLNQFDRALDHFNKGVAILLQNVGEAHPNLAPFYNNIGNCHLSEGNYREAIKYHLKALTLREAQFGRKHPMIAYSFGNLAECYVSLRQYDEAIDYFQKAFRIFNQKKHEYPSEVAQYYGAIGHCYSLKEDYPKAIQYYDKALDALHLSSTDFNNLERQLAPQLLLTILGFKAETLSAYFEKEQNAKLLYQAKDLFGKAVETVNFLKRSFRESGSKQILLDKSFPVFEGMILTCYQLFELTDSTEYLHEAFQYAEKSNGVLLQDAVQKARAEKYAGIPQNLLEREQNLKIDIAFNERRRFDEEQKGARTDLEKISQLNNQIFDLKQAYFQLIDTFEQTYPRYYELRYEAKTPTIQEIQKNMTARDQSVVEYFVGDNHIFVFVFNSDAFEVVHLPKNYPLEAWVEECRNSIIQFNPLHPTASFLKQKYANIAFEIYQLIFEPIKPYLKTTVTIIPGGILGYLPFDALISELPDEETSFKAYPYLLHDYQFNYSYSASLSVPDAPKLSWEESQIFLGFAPKFGAVPLNAARTSRSLSLNELKYNIPEVMAIQELIGGRAFLGEAATEEQFLAFAEDYRILHLATHGKANDQASDFSFLAFTEIPDTIENEFLFVKDLYNLRLHADMVVLSACETGVGELRRGEGIISLARGFFYAGAKSIITTLWNIDDKPTSIIMQNFYQNLSTGQMKDEALHSAKLNYLKKTPSHALAHPLFWAAFVPVGDMTAINLGTPNGKIWWWMSGVALLIGGFFLLKRKI